MDLSFLGSFESPSFEEAVDNLDEIFHDFSVMSSPPVGDGEVKGRARERQRAKEEGERVRRETTNTHESRWPSPATSQIKPPEGNPEGL